MIPTALIERFGPAGAKAVFFGGIAALVALALLLSYCTGRGDGKRVEVVKQQERTIEVLEDVGEANEAAAGTRVADATRIALDQKELEDALKATTDPDTRRVLRGCIIMRQQGRDTAGIPACGRPAPAR